MRIDISKKANHALVTLDGSVDGKTAPEAQAALGPVLAEFSLVVLDLSKVEYMSSAGLRVLLLINRQLSAKKGKAVIVGLNDSIAETMRVTGFLQFFECHASLSEVKL